MIKTISASAFSALSIMLLSSAPALAQTGGNVSDAARSLSPGSFGQTVSGANKVFAGTGGPCRETNGRICYLAPNPFYDEFSDEAFYTTPGVGALFGQRANPTPGT